MRSFVMSALRRAQWPQRHQALKKAFIGYGINPATGRQCKLHQCEHCQRQFPQSGVHADHINSVIPLQHNWADGNYFLGYDWNEVIQRLYIEADGYQILCHECHAKVGDDERAARKL
jgi:hypothetical protein